MMVTDRQTDRMSIANTACACYASCHNKQFAFLCCYCCNASGTLVSYLLLRELRRRDGPMHINWLKVVVHRYWRYVTSLVLHKNVYNTRRHLWCYNEIFFVQWLCLRHRQFIRCMLTPISRDVVSLYLTERFTETWDKYSSCKWAKVSEGRGHRVIV